MALSLRPHRHELIKGETLLILLKYGLNLHSRIFTALESNHARIRGGEDGGEAVPRNSHELHQGMSAVVAFLKLIRDNPGAVQCRRSGGRAGANIGRFGSAGVPLPMIGTMQ
jgi:hypothetical protein